MLVQGAVVASVAKTIKDMKRSDELEAAARKKQRNAYRAISQAEAERASEEERMNQAIGRLITRKKGVLITSIDKFIVVYEKIKEIKFKESDGIRELDNFSPACCQEVSKQVVAISRRDFMTSGMTKNVVKGFLFGGLAGAISASIVDDAENKLNMAKDTARQAAVFAEEKRIHSLAYREIAERANRMADLLTELNTKFFVKSLRNTEQLIEVKGKNRDKYTSDDFAQIGTCLDLAKAIKDIIDAPIIDKEGELSQKTLQIIEEARQCITNMKEDLTAI